MSKVYFPNLNGLRFIAALLVIVHHLEQMKSLVGLDNSWSNPVVYAIGKLGVVLFFALSGFLITFLLLEEEKQTKTISVKDFYLRRIFRIWPLYYLIVGLGFLVINRLDFFALGNLTNSVYNNLPLKLTMFMFFLPNLSLATFPPVPFIAQTWSVGVEEQFYLIWPVLIKNVKRKALLLLLIIAGYLFMKFVAIPMLAVNLRYTLEHAIVEFWDTFSIDCMAIGGLFALCLFNQNKILRIFFSKSCQIITYSLIFVLIAQNVELPYLSYEVFSILFGVVIINLAANKKSLLNLEYPIFNYLGKISFGLYMFHPVAIWITLKGLGYISITNWEIQYSLAISLSILIAGLSYKYFESYFLEKKLKFAKIISGESAKSS